MRCEYRRSVVRLELPNWQIRRYHVYWICVGKEYQERVARSNFENAAQRPHLPLALDGTADGTHDDLPLAILRVLIEAV